MVSEARLIRHRSKSWAAGRSLGARPSTAVRDSLRAVSLSTLLYRLSRIVGDAAAIRKGRYPQRLARRAAYRQSGRLTRRLLRRVGL